MRALAAPNAQVEPLAHARGWECEENAQSQPLAHARGWESAARAPRIPSRDRKGAVAHATFAFAFAFASAFALSLSACDRRASLEAMASAAAPSASRSAVPSSRASAWPSASSRTSPRTRAFDDPAVGLAALCARAKVPSPPKAPRVVVEKAARALVLFDGATRVATFPIALGPSPEGPKLREGDGRTPEGKLRIVTRNEKSKYRRFLGLGYPTAADGARGLRDGVISRSEADAIGRAERERTQPPWGTKLGGAVGIHGNGSWLDWTAGCVALDDDAIDVLWAAAPIGTEVEIVP